MIRHARALTWAGVVATGFLLSAGPGAVAAQDSRITLVSLVTGEAAVSDGEAASPSVSADGRYVVFSSTSAALVPDDTNGQADVFVRDTVERVTARVSVDCDGDQAVGGDSVHPSITPDGRFVVYESAATGLVGGDVNGLTDIFVHDLTTGVTDRVSVGTDGSQAAVGDSVDASISADGRYVAFTSGAPNLTPGDLNGSDDVFVRDTVEEVTILVSATPGAVAGTGPSSQGEISDDGRYVAFSSIAADLVAADLVVADPGNGDSASDVFVRDLGAAATELVSVGSRASDGSVGPVEPGESDQPTISADGSRVAFRTTALLADGDNDAMPDIVVRDRMGATTFLASVGAQGAPADGPSQAPDISGDGRWIAFESDATGLVPGDANGLGDVFVRDTAAGTTVLGSVADSGAQADSPAVEAALGADGRYLTFASAATTLVPGDGNGISDVFVTDLRPPVPAVASVSVGPEPDPLFVTPEPVAADTAQEAADATPGSVVGPAEAPQALAVTLDGSYLTATWSSPLADGGSPVVGYTVTATPAGRGASLGCEVIREPLTCVIGPLTRGATYGVSVVAVNGAGLGAPSSTAVVADDGRSTTPTGATTMTATTASVPDAPGGTEPGDSEGPTATNAPTTLPTDSGTTMSTAAPSTPSAPSPPIVESSPSASSRSLEASGH